jgi:hypothetical protein
MAWRFPNGYWLDPHPPDLAGWDPSALRAVFRTSDTTHLKTHQISLSTPHPHLIFTLSLTFIFIVLPPIVFLFIKWGEGYIIFLWGSGVSALKGMELWVPWQAPALFAVL